MIARIGPCLMLVLALLGFAPLHSVRADADLSVLNLTSMEGDDTVALALSEALRQAVSDVTGWEVTPQSVSLTQMSVVYGCRDESDTDCLSQIAQALTSPRLVYGSMWRSRREAPYDYWVSLNVFDRETGEITSITGTLPSAARQADQLDSYAETLVRQLFGKELGAVIIRSELPVADVYVDGHRVGELQQGSFVWRGVPVGSYQLKLVAEGHQPYTEGVAVTTGKQTHVQARFIPNVTPPQPSGAWEASGLLTETGSGSTGKWIGIGLLGASAALIGATLYSWFKLESISDDADFVAYQRRVGVHNPSSQDVCRDAKNNLAYAERGSPEFSRFDGVQSMCSTAGTLEVLQYVFLGSALVAGGIGTYLLVSHSGQEAATAESAPRAAPLTVHPTLGLTSAGLDATLRF